MLCYTGSCVSCVFLLNFFYIFFIKTSPWIVKLKWNSIWFDRIFVCDFFSVFTFKIFWYHDVALCVCWQVHVLHVLHVPQHFEPHRCNSRRPSTKTSTLPSESEVVVIGQRLGGLDLCWYPGGCRETCYRLGITLSSRWCSTYISSTCQRYWGRFLLWFWTFFIWRSQWRTHLVPFETCPIRFWGKNLSGFSMTGRGMRRIRWVRCLRMFDI